MDTSGAERAQEVEDVEEAARAGRQVRAHGPYRIQLGDERLEFRPLLVAAPTLTGQQILEAAGLEPQRDWIVFQLLSSGLLEELRPDEETDLRRRGIEKFLAFRSDRTFRFELDGRSFDWGAPRVSGLTLKKLASVDVVTYGVWLEVPGADDQPIGDRELADLTPPKVERFFTGILQTTEG